MAKIIPELRGRAFYRMMSYCSALAFMTYGYDAGVLGGVQETEPFLDAIGNPTGAITIPIIASSYTLGSLVMALFLAASNFGHRYGRRVSIMFGDALIIIGGLIQATSFSVAQITTARVICGLGIGLVSATVPTYMSETTINKTERGPQVAIQCIFLINGVALAYWVDFGFTRLMHQQVSWRFPIALQSLFTLASLIGFLTLPDTPRWYYSKGRIAEGDRVLARLFDLPEESEEVQRQRNEILETIRLETQGGSIRWTDWFWDKSQLQNARRIRTSFLILSLQQLMGINILVYFTTTLLKNVGLSSFLQQLVAAVINTIFAMGTWPAPFFIERWGRRPMMFWSAVGCTITMAIFIALEGAGSSQALQWGAVVIVMLFIFLIGFGWMGCPWLYGPEVSPLRYRHLGGAAGAVGEWSMTFVTVFGGGIALRSVSYEIWLWQLFSCAVACIFVWFWCPETAGKSLEEIDDVFMEDAKKWRGWEPRLEVEVENIDGSSDSRSGGKEEEGTFHNERM